MLPPPSGQEDRVKETVTREWANQVAPLGFHESRIDYQTASMNIIPSRAHAMLHLNVPTIQCKTSDGHRKNRLGGVAMQSEQRRIPLSADLSLRVFLDPFIVLEG